MRWEVIPELEVMKPLKYVRIKQTFSPEIVRTGEVMAVMGTEDRLRAGPCYLAMKWWPDTWIGERLYADTVFYIRVQDCVDLPRWSQ
jgi:hypothetical protein